MQNWRLLGRRRRTGLYLFAQLVNLLLLGLMVAELATDAHKTLNVSQLHIQGHNGRTRFLSSHGDPKPEPNLLAERRMPAAGKMLCLGLLCRAYVCLHFLSASCGKNSYVDELHRPPKRSAGNKQQQLLMLLQLLQLHTCYTCYTCYSCCYSRQCLAALLAIVETRAVLAGV